MGSLDDYILEEVIYRTSTGTVQAARYRPTDHRVAVEQLSADLLTTPGFTERIAECGRQASTLRHPNIVSVYDLIGDSDGLWLVTGLVSGRTLRSVCPAGAALEPRVALTVADDVLAALEAAHAGGVVHGDIQPEVIFVTDHAQALVSGFGIRLAVATTAAVPAWRRPATGGNEDHPPGSVAGDLWAAAAMVRELITAANPAQPARVAPPPEVAEVLEHALAVDPAHRFGSATDLRNALGGAARRDLGSDWRWRGDIGAAAFRPAPVAPAPARRPPGYPREIGVPHRRRRLLLKTAVGLIAIVAAAGILFLVTRNDSTPQQAGPLHLDDDLTVLVSPTSASCGPLPKQSGKGATFVAEARGTLSGSGTLTYEFRWGDGKATQYTTEITTETSYIFRDPHVFVGPVQTGTVTVAVTSPVKKMATQTFTYSCQ